MVHYFTEDTSFVYKGKRRTSAWLMAVAESHSRRLGEISVIFCPDPYLLEVNRKYLGHDYYTDIITFDYCEDGLLSGDLFISVDTVRENAAFYGVPFDDELHRVIVHGLLHLIGFDDHTEEDVKTMRHEENEALKLLDGQSL